MFVPFNSKPNSIQRTKNLVKELEELNINYNLIFTQYTSDRELNSIKDEFENLDYYLHNTKMLDIMIREDITIDECLENTTYNNWFKNHAIQLKQLVNDLKGAM